MIRTSRRQHGGPVYRDVLSRALRSAWEERRFWPLAFCASLLLTGGIYDVIWKALSSVTDQGVLMQIPTGQAHALGALFLGAFSSVPNILNLVTGIQAVILVAILLLALTVLSCICQGALVYAIGAIHRGNRPDVRHALQIGGAAFWPIAALNALSLTTIWILRFLIAFALSLALGSSDAVNWLSYFISFLLFGTLVFIISIVQVFALNALILQGAPISEAILRGYLLFKKHWIVALETTGLLLLVAMFVGAVFVCLYFLLMVPLFAAILAAMYLRSPGLLYGAMGLGFAVFVIGTVAASAFLTQLQYAAWTILFRKIGEGGVLPKLHRWIRDISGGYGRIPQ
jgi:hypothetical protein